MTLISTNLNLPYIAPAQAQKHVTHNEALRGLDALVQLSLLSLVQTTPPTSPSEGERYFTPPNAMDTWEDHDGYIAAFQDGAWAYYFPQVGWQAWVEDENVLKIWDGTTWQTPSPQETHQNLAHMGINTTADAANRLAVSSAATLFNHAGNGHQLKLNKNAATDTASLLYQTNWSGRAELGLTGDDNFHIKVSPDASTWHEALTVSANNGDVACGNIAPSCKLHVDGPARVKSYTISTLPSAASTGAGAILYVSDETGGGVMAFSDGSDWRRVTDRAVVS